MWNKAPRTNGRVKGKIRTNDTRIDGHAMHEDYVNRIVHGGEPHIEFT